MHWKGRTNETNYDTLETQFGRTVSPKSFVMGVLGIFVFFFGRLQHNMIRDLLLFSALHIRQLSQLLKANVEKVNREGQTILEITSKLKQQHTEILQKANEINDLLGTLFKLIHVDNWLFCSYFFLDLLHGRVRDIYFVEAIIIIPKILGAYLISADAISTVRHRNLCLNTTLFMFNAHKCCHNCYK